MVIETGHDIVDRPELRDRVNVFRDRADAGKVLADMLDSYGQSDTIVLGIPAGGVPVGVVVARQLNLAFDVSVVSKITLPWNTEAGYGAVAFDGTVKLNQELLPQLGLSAEDIEEGIEKTRSKVARRVRDLRGKQPFPNIAGHSVILVDDGIASGFTMLVAIEALRGATAEHIAVAVPTGHSGSVQKIATEVEALYCANVRSGWRFAVADAYEEWSDVDEKELVSILADSKL
jgi:predicted phosphoribosyltransferase